MARPTARTVGALVLSVTLAGPVPAQVADPAGPAAVRRKIADGKAAADATDALQAADRLARTDPAAAAKVVRAAARSLDLAPDVTDATRDALAQKLQTRLDQLAGRAAPPAAPAGKPGIDPKLAPAAAAEAKDIRDAVVKLAPLYDRGRFAEAQGLINDLTRKYPDNPAVLVLAANGTYAERVGEAKRLAAEQAARSEAAFRDVTASAMPAVRDQEFPKGWAEKMAARDRLTAVDIGPDELAILKALDARVEKEIKDGPFEEVVEAIATLIQKPIVIDRQALADDNRDLKKLVTMPGNVTARTALRAVVQSQGMTFIIRDKAIQVVSLDEARRTLVKKAYYLGDVLGTPLGGGATLGAGVDYALATQTAAQIIDSIKKSIDPKVWAGEGSGGLATITFHPASLSIVVSAPAEVHYSVGTAVRPKR